MVDRKGMPWAVLMELKRVGSKVDLMEEMWVGKLGCLKAVLKGNHWETTWVDRMELLWELPRVVPLVGWKDGHSAAH